MRGSWLLKASGAATRWALYSGYSAVRKVDAGNVPGHRHCIRVMVPEELDEHPREPVGGVGDLARGRRQVGGQGKERPIGDRVSI